MLKIHEILFILPGFLIGITLHEFAHAYSGKLLGDGLAASQGRVSLNPLRHLSPLGTLMILFLGFGWARPVEVNPYNFKRPRVDFLMCSLAGPFANFVLLLFFSMVLRFTPIYSEVWLRVFLGGAYINGILMVLNLLPIPPLDGSRIWPVLFPQLRLVNRSRLNFLWIILIVGVLQFDLLNGLFAAVISVINLLIGW